MAKLSTTRKNVTKNGVNKRRLPETNHTKSQDLKWYDVRIGTFLQLIASFAAKVGARVNWKNVAIVSVFLYIVSLFTPAIWPFSHYPLHMLRCGGLPVTATSFKKLTYYLPGDSGYGPSMLTSAFYCTERQATDDGAVRAYTSIPRP
ncbi:hypothetical protein JNJ66_02750 [Candidatus Saccharibacteria bacterium]|nr:hypothetical protein [Candidatus Saccharibacteria bacterium]